VFKFSGKNLTYIAFFCLLAVFLLSISIFKNQVLDISSMPLSLLNLTRREIAGIIFYHRNFVQKERLKAEIELLKLKLTDAQEIKLENVRLNNLLTLKQKSAFKVIVARVIGRSPDNWSSVVIIDKGVYNGVKPKMMAMSYSGLIGKVIESSNHVSKIILINDPNFTISAISQRSRQEGLVCGTLSGVLIMRYLNSDSDIRVQDTIITSGLTGNCPKGLPIGSVIALEDEFSGLSRYAIIKPAVDLSNIEEVLIIIP